MDEEFERIMAMSDEEITEELWNEGIDPDEAVKTCREIWERVKCQIEAEKLRIN